MNEINSTNKERKQAENIRKQYISREQDKMLQLKKLDNKVKLPGRVVASVMGAAGALIMGGGMSLIMVWENMKKGLSLGIPGMVLVLLAYPTYLILLRKRKKKYAETIVKLSEEIV